MHSNLVAPSMLLSWRSWSAMHSNSTQLSKTRRFFKGERSRLSQGVPIGGFCTMPHPLRRRECRAAAAAAAIAAAIVTSYITPSLFKTPQNDSALTGHAWVRELLAGHPRRFHNMMSMSKHVFRTLARELQEISGLCDSNYIAFEEQLAIFLPLRRLGGPNRYLQEIFQRSPDTISKYEQYTVFVVVVTRYRLFHRLLGMVTSTAFYT